MTANMKMRLYFIIGLLILAGSFQSCKKFLDRKPINQATDENFWTTESEAENATAGSYALLRTALNEMGFAYYYYGDFATDEFAVPPAGEDFPQLNAINWNF